MAEIDLSGAGAAQDTGNPVLDSTVNLVRAFWRPHDVALIKEIHQVVLELAEKEPGGLKVRTTGGHLGEVSAYGQGDENL